MNSGSSGEPDAIDPSVWQKLNRVRVDLWSGALGGLVIGALVGKAGHDILRALSKNKKAFTKNTSVLAMVASACTLSYLGSVVLGKQSLSRAIFFDGPVLLPNTPQDKKEEEELPSFKISTYQSQILRNQREIVANFDDSFQRRAEIIRKSKEAATDSPNSGHPRNGF